MPAVEIQVRPRVNRSWLPSALGLFTRLASQERWLRWDYLRRVEWAVAVRARGPNGERLVPHRNGASSRTCPNTLRLTVVSGVFNRRAAADKLPCSTTVRKVDIASSRSIGPPSIIWNNIFRFMIRGRRRCQRGAVVPGYVKWPPNLGSPIQSRKVVGVDRRGVRACGILRHRVALSRANDFRAY
jgi:hypothetical protein